MCTTKSEKIYNKNKTNTSHRRNGNGPFISMILCAQQKPTKESEGEVETDRKKHTFKTQQINVAFCWVLLKNKIKHFYCVYHNSFEFLLVTTTYSHAICWVLLSNLSWSIILMVAKSISLPNCTNSLRWFGPFNCWQLFKRSIKLLSCFFLLRIVQWKRKKILFTFSCFFFFATTAMKYKPYQLSISNEQIRFVDRKKEKKGTTVISFFYFNRLTAVYLWPGQSEWSGC